MNRNIQFEEIAAAGGQEPARRDRPFAHLETADRLAEDLGIKLTGS